MLKTVIRKKIGIFGYGLEGKGLVSYLLKHGARNITVFDERIIKAEERIEGLQYIYSDFEKNDYDIDLAFRSPGIKLDRLNKILKGKVEISSATNLFFELAKGRKIIVTGTKGKSTTVAIIERVLKLSGLSVYTGGNMGKSPLDFIDELDKSCYTIVELSSFQLQDFKGRADYYVFLPISADHLDYHRDFEEYLQAKKKAVSSSNSQSVIILQKDELSGSLTSGVQGQFLYYSLSRDLIEKGCFQDGPDCKCQDENEKLEVRNILGLSQDKKIPLVNLVASSALFFKMKLKVDLKKALEDFDKPEFRVEFIGNFSGVDIYNDSASTNPISTIEALHLMNRPLALIVGGSDKGLDYCPLVSEIAGSDLLKRVYLFGQTGKSINKLLQDRGSQGKALYRETLEDILKDLSESPKDFGNLLFSPASASFDQFRNYQHRGQVFEELVKKYFK